MNILFKSIGFLLTLLFGIGAAVQYNDPDSLVWIIVYLAAALVSLLFALDKLNILIPLVGGVVCFMGFVILYPSDFQGFDLDDGDIKTVELGRESFGLLIISLVCILYTFRLKRSSKV